MKDNLLALQLDEKNKRLYVRFVGFWGDLHSLEYDEKQELIKYMIERAFKQKVFTPHPDLLSRTEKIERDFKQTVFTSSNIIPINDLLIEKSFRNNIKI